MSNWVWLSIVVGIWLLVSLGWWRTRKAKRADNASGVVYHLVRYSTFYLLPFAAIMTLYVALAFYLQLYTDRVSIGWLIMVEQRLEWASSFFDRYFTLSERYVLAALVVVFVASCIGIYVRQRQLARSQATTEPTKRWARHSYRLIGRYHKYSVAIGMCLALLASLTFFGMKLGTPTNSPYGSRQLRTATP